MSNGIEPYFFTELANAGTPGSCFVLLGLLPDNSIVIGRILFSISFTGIALSSAYYVRFDPWTPVEVNNVPPKVPSVP